MRVLPDEAMGKIFEASEIAKVSVVGVGMRSHSGVAATLFDALAGGGVNIQLVSTSEIKISVGIDPKDAEEATPRTTHSVWERNPLRLRSRRFRRAFRTVFL